MRSTDNVADFNNDDIVDTTDLCELSGLWLADANDPGWNIKYDLYGDNVIDYRDFAYFAQEWMWMTCDKMLGYKMMEMMMRIGGGMGMMGGESMLISETPTAPLAAATLQKASTIPFEPSVAEQIEQIKEILDWLYEVRETIDEKTWLNLVTSLEEMLKELQQD